MSLLGLVAIVGCPSGARGPTERPSAKIATPNTSTATVATATAARAVDRSDAEDDDSVDADAIEAAYAEAPPPPPPTRDLSTIASNDVKPSRGGLKTILRRKQLRILIHGDGMGYLPRPGLPALGDIDMAEAFARSIDVEPKFVLVESYDDLIPALRAGKGDMIAAQMTVTRARARKVAFARSTLGTAEILVGKEGAADLPKSVEELDGRQVHVRASSAYASTLKELGQARRGPKIEIVPVGEHESTEEIVESVADGRRSLTVADAHLLDAMQTYATGFVRLFPLTERRQIAWAVRKQNRGLRDALNRFLQGHALTVHTRVTATPDLAGIKERKVLRVLTRNNALTYLLYRGAQFGFDYDLSELLAEALGVRLEIIVVPSRDQLIPWLLEGRGDLIAASLTATDDRMEKVLFSRPYLYTDEVIVARKRARDAPKTIEDLAGRTVHVRSSSSYARTLQALQARGIDIKIAEVPEDMETEAIIEGVAKRKYALTVADRHILEVELAYGTRVQAGPKLTEVAPRAEREATRFAPDGGKDIAFAMRPDAVKLKAFIDGWIKKNYRGRRYNILKRRYLSSGRAVRRYRRRRVGRTGQISPYDKIIQKYASRYHFDWRLMAAQAFVESRFNPKAQSWVGARGLFQVMPRTGASLGFYKLEDPDVGTHAGIKYMDRLVRRFDPKLPFRQRVRFALAAYNAGLGHVMDARKLARQKGWDPDRWFGNVERAMLLLSERKYYRKARHGYCRGKEPVAYVSHIQAKYQAYVEITDQR